jgi:sarcosine oxidase subunit delta
MMLIECPYCGPRVETEFGYGGQAHVDYPKDPYALSDEEWARFLFYRDNPRGVHAERWLHSAGCRKWFNAIRDTHTYEISHVYRLGQGRPDLGERDVSPEGLNASLTAAASPERAAATPSMRRQEPPA